MWNGKHWIILKIIQSYIWNSRACVPIENGFIASLIVRKKKKLKKIYNMSGVKFLKTFAPSIRRRRHCDKEKLEIYNLETNDKTSEVGNVWDAIPTSPITPPAAFLAPGHRRAPKKGKLKYAWKKLWIPYKQQFIILSRLDSLSNFRLNNIKIHYILNKNHLKEICIMSRSTTKFSRWYFINLGATIYFCTFNIPLHIRQDGTFLQKNKPFYEWLLCCSSLYWQKNQFKVLVTGSCATFQKDKIILLWGKEWNKKKNIYLV